MLTKNYFDLQERLKIDCETCSGLCCVALYCTKTDGFPSDKEAGVPCKHLMPDFRCDRHATLASQNMRGCLAYDCFGAGQKVTQSHFSKHNWRNHPDHAKAMFEVFHTVFQLHQMEWYLLEALSLTTDEPLKSEVEFLISENERLTSLPSDEILQVTIEDYRLQVNQVLKQVIGMMTKPADKKKGKNFLGHNFMHANLNHKDFSMALLIAADLEGCSLKGTSFLGADLRDANLKNTDLSSSIFLTQMQINSARGNANTKLKGCLSRPPTWHET